MEYNNLFKSTADLQFELDELMETIRKGIQTDIRTSYLMELNKRVSGLQAVIAVQIKMMERMAG